MTYQVQELGKCITLFTKRLRGQLGHPNVDRTNVNQHPGPQCHYIPSSRWLWASVCHSAGSHSPFVDIPDQARPGPFFFNFQKLLKYWMAWYVGVDVTSYCYKFAHKWITFYSHTHHGECLGEKLLNQFGYLPNTRKRLSQNGWISGLLQFVTNDLLRKSDIRDELI